MLERNVACFVTTVALLAGFSAAAQPELSEQARREREQEALARESQRIEEQFARRSEELQRELARAREQLAASASEIARLSAQMTEPVLRELPNVSFVNLGRRAVLGLNIDDTDLGVRVSGVTPNGPADDAGIEVGDTIVAVDGVDLARGAANGRRSPSQVLLAQIEDLEPGDEVELRILRDGDYRDVEVVAENRSPFVFNNGQVHVFRPDEWIARFEHFGGGPWRDIELVTLTPALGEYFGTDEGLLVVRAGSAAELGLRDGDVLLEIGGREPQSPEHAMRILNSFEPGESLQASIMRQRRRETLTIEVPESSRSGQTLYFR